LILNHPSLIDISRKNQTNKNAAGGRERGEKEIRVG
jgi:hypothetical protein